MRWPVRSEICTLLIAIASLQSAASQPVLRGDTLAQDSNSDTVIRSAGRAPSKNNRATAYVVPAALFTYGCLALQGGALRKLDTRVQQEIYAKRPHAPFHADDYLVWAPAVAVYGLDAAGIKGAHGMIDKSILYIASFMVAHVSAGVLKRNSRQVRPDGSDLYSFPSGHTAAAFVSAEFLRQEYAGVSSWYGAGGYATAAATGLLRIYNNKHWLSNTLAGAGIGMASVKLVYWVYPLLRKIVVKDKSQTLVLPMYEHGAMGVRLFFVLNQDYKD